MRKAVIIAITVGVLGFAGYQAYCRIAYKRDIEKLCLDAVTREVRSTISREQFVRLAAEPPVQTWSGLRVNGGYELANGAGARSWTCSCACSGTTPTLLVTIH